MSFPALKLDLETEFKVAVHTTENPGVSPEEGAARFADKIVLINDSASPSIKAQAHAFRKHLVKVLEFYMREAIKSDRTTVYNAIKDAGHPDLAELIRRL